MTFRAGRERLGLSEYKMTLSAHEKSQQICAQTICYAFARRPIHVTRSTARQEWKGVRITNIRTEDEMNHYKSICTPKSN